MVDVFISYSRKDQAAVARLARAVMAEGYDVWWDAELPPHKSYGEVITAKIAEASATIVVWSKDAVQSEWVRAEADMARGQRKLVQTALDAAVPPLPFNQIQYAAIGDWRGEGEHPGWRKVKASLAELCGAPSGERVTLRALPSEPPPTPPARASRWPLFAGIAVGVFGAALGAGALLTRRAEPPPVVERPSFAIARPSPEPAAAPAAPAAPADGYVAEEDAPSVADPVSAPLQPTAAATFAAEHDPPPINAADMTFADSSTRLLKPSEVYPLGPSTLKIARNEIFARKGMRFTTPFLRDWFSRFAWYEPRYDRVPINDVERQNIALIRQAEARYQ